LLVDGKLVAGCSGYFATLVVIKGSVDDHVDGVDDDLSDCLTVHCVFEVNFFLEVDLAFDRLVLDFVIDHVIHDVFVF
jgi:hypothetical protein